MYDRLYLVCNDCSQRFESIDDAHEHLLDEQTEYNIMGELHPGFDILTDEEVA